MNFFKPNRNYFLETFYTDSDNWLTFKAIRSFLHWKKFRFNPICLYGPAGTGKTHILQAITYEMLVSRKTIHSTTAQGYMDDIMRSLMYSSMKRLRELYRSVDVLLIDNVHELAGKPKCQEELTFTLINRFENGKATIFSSLVHPMQLVGFDEWLSSRLGMGLSLELKPQNKYKLSPERKKKFKKLMIAALEEEKAIQELEQNQNDTEA